VQDATANFALAVSASTVAWLPPLVYADWAQDGYGTTNSIDDLSGQSNNIQISHGLDDGLPDEVAFGTTSGVPTLTADLGGRGEVTAARYFSPFRTDSPLYGYERDVAPLKVDHGLVTAGGKERIRVFTGQMADAPVTGEKASLQGISATRVALSTLVQPPVIAGVFNLADTGLTASWPVSFSLYQCGIYSSPPPVPGCRVWIPMHGGGNAMLPSENRYHGVPSLKGIAKVTGDTFFDLAEPRGTRGPFVGAGRCRVTADKIAGWSGFVSVHDMETGDDWLTTAGSRGRLQFYVRGDLVNVNTAPGGSASFNWDEVADVGGPSDQILAGAYWTTPASGPYVVAGVDLSRRVFVHVFDGTHNATLTSSASVASDGEWHLVGAAWDVANNQLWVNVDGTVTTSTPSPTLSTAGLGSTHLTGELDDGMNFNSALTFAEVHFTTGANASPAVDSTWLDTQTWTRRAYLYPSSLRLVAVAEAQPREAWEYISSLAQAECASLRIDENDAVQLWPRGYFATVAGQTVAETITTDLDAGVPDVAMDRTRIRNVARVTYRQTRIDAQLTQSPILDFRSLVAIPTGVTQISFALPTPVIALLDSLFGSLTHLTANQIAGIDPFAVGPNYVSLNTSSDALGTYSTSSDVDVTVVSWDAGQVLVQFNNLTSFTWYLVNDSDSQGTDFAYLAIQGIAIPSTDATVTEAYGASLDVRGERAVVVNLPAIQSSVDAARVARRILGDLAFPQPVIPQVDVFGDPRRQPGDLVVFTDDAETGANGQWRCWAVKHRINGADYRQTLRLSQARSVGRWGDGVSRWGRVVWAGLEEDA